MSSGVAVGDGKGVKVSVGVSTGVFVGRGIVTVGIVVCVSCGAVVGGTVL